MSDLVVIPARYGSTRFPGKPLAEIAGRSLLSRMIDLGQRTITGLDGVDLVVATDDKRIYQHAETLGVKVVMTQSQISSGSGRALAAAKQMKNCPQYIVNLQGDAPFANPDALRAILLAIRSGQSDVATPVVQLSWFTLDALRDHKEKAPFSGTTCIRGADGRAIWFSKNIIPAIRNEAKLRVETQMSPIYQHLGLYAYNYSALEQFEERTQSYYEQLEGLEQLRFLEMGLSIAAIETEPPRISVSGIDTPEDVAWAERQIAEYGDPFGQYP